MSKKHDLASGMVLAQAAVAAVIGVVPVSVVPGLVVDSFEFYSQLQPFMPPPVWNNALFVSSLRDGHYLDHRI